MDFDSLLIKNPGQFYLLSEILISTSCKLVFKIFIRSVSLFLFHLLPASDLPKAYRKVDNLRNSRQYPGERIQQI